MLSQSVRWCYQRWGLVRLWCEAALCTSVIAGFPQGKKPEFAVLNSEMPANPIPLHYIPMHSLKYEVTINSKNNTTKKYFMTVLKNA